ncbi:MAG: hypothetical protein AB1757_02140 [Acidobacteriota bacterium]
MPKTSKGNLFLMAGASLIALV